MGRKSVKENKSIYQTTREELGLTRERAAEMIPGFSPERIEKIENERVQIRPEDVKMIAEAYRRPGLCNYYCSQECPIGIGKTPRVERKELLQIVVETLNGVNRINAIQGPTAGNRGGRSHHGGRNGGLRGNPADAGPAAGFRLHAAAVAGGADGQAGKDEGALKMSGRLTKAIAGRWRLLAGGHGSLSPCGCLAEERRRCFRTGYTTWCCRRR